MKKKLREIVTTRRQGSVKRSAVRAAWQKIMAEQKGSAKKKTGTASPLKP